MTPNVARLQFLVSTILASTILHVQSSAFYAEDCITAQSPVCPRKIYPDLTRLTKDSHMLPTYSAHEQKIAPSSQRVSLSDSGVGLTTSATKCSGAAVACVRGRRRLTESEYESVRSLSTDSKSLKPQRQGN
ncbi:unnamed protein product [Phytophthora fragariaefolia]|uniref:Unnamed protein product n=1 Tax=Phytophthora fragariaefolia TaxID=1490495 RepID=A0A9W6YBK8_9STRA|nr:unnamed protein product [Phytophthora fragariaefolia]